METGCCIENFPAQLRLHLAFSVCVRFLGDVCKDILYFVEFCLREVVCCHPTLNLKEVGSYVKNKLDPM